MNRISDQDFQTEVISSVFETEIHHAAFTIKGMVEGLEWWNGGKGYPFRFAKRALRQASGICHIYHNPCNDSNRYPFYGIPEHTRLPLLHLQFDPGECQRKTISFPLPNTKAFNSILNRKLYQPD